MIYMINVTKGPLLWFFLAKRSWLGCIEKTKAIQDNVILKREIGWTLYSKTYNHL